MNETFSLKRFSLLVRKQFIEQYKLYLMSAVVLVGVLAFMFTIAWGSGYDQRFQKMIMQGGLIIGGAVFSSMLFRDISNPAHSILSLSLPASHLEKFLCAWVYGLFFFVPAYLLIFYCVDITAVKIANVFNTPHVQVLRLNNPYLGNILSIFFLAQSIAMLGSIAFKKWHFIQTAFLAFLIIFAILWLDYFMAHGLIPADDLSGGVLLGGIRFTDDGLHQMQMPAAQAAYESRTFLPVPGGIKNITELTFYLLPVLFWFTAFLKLKEKQL